MESENEIYSKFLLSEGIATNNTNNVAQQQNI